MKVIGINGSARKDWNMVYGKNIGEVVNDKEGMENMKNLGQNMAWALKKMKSEI